MKKLSRRFLIHFNSQRGSVITTVAVLMVVLLGMTALVVDVGDLYVSRRQMVNAADSAALAGAQELITNPGNVETVAQYYAINLNGSDSDKVQVEKTSNTVTVTTGKTVDYTFARAIGFTSENVPATATALVGTITEYGGLIPIGLQEKVYTELTKNEVYTLITFDNFGVVGPGNWGWVNLTGSHGQQSTKDQISNIIYGYPDPKKVGDKIYTDTGANIGAPGNLKDYDWRLDEYIENETILYIPIVSNEWTSGKSQIVTILGFAPIILHDYEASAQSFKIAAEISKPMLAEGPIDPNLPSFGLLGITLIE